MNMTIQQVEAALNRCSAMHPPINHQIQKEPRLLCDVWGQMIYEQAKTIDLDELDLIHREVLMEWSAF
ncbi:DUF3717 domain-containing protein [Sulfurirhabdus autotrophica]|uniref:Uncharacterized protein DUF3717 n=1 Tax=Sulfurirhabdus autotrophica TaxID=1706046 RepID=A0A4R3XUA1_9PROT|nr:DUF3717 domain-containing protein [Sulfurirhabdus autotrophica]TCV82710.1 uncharacterized protein DUF3717 [Sulfurirhabdus autotrophica]